MVSDWQPIETAPKDGTRILIATRSIDGGVQLVAWFGPACAAFYDETGDSYIDATHWMPLPSPPQDPQHGGGIGPY